MNPIYTSQIIIGEGTNADVDTTEEDVVVVSDTNKLLHTQLTIYLDTVFGTNTSVEYRFYYQNQKDGNWYARPKWNASDNTLDDYPAIVDSTSPVSSGGHVYTVFEFGLASCYGFKVTAKGAGGANSSCSVRIMSRNN